MIPVLVGIASVVTALAAVARLSNDQELVFEPFAGVFLMDDGERQTESSQRFDDQGASLLLGARAIVPPSDRWDVVAEYGHASLDSKLRLGDEPDATSLRTEIVVHSFLGMVRRSWALGSLQVYAGAGAGALRIDADEPERETSAGTLVPADVGFGDPEPETDALVAIGLGARHQLHDRFAAAVEARDIVHECDAAGSGFDDPGLFCSRDAWLHHIQVTASLRVEL